MNKGELNEVIAETPDVTNVIIEIVGKDDRESLIRSAVGAEIRHDNKEGRDVIVIHCYKSLKEQNQKFGEARRTTQTTINRLTLLHRQQEENARAAKADKRDPGQTATGADAGDPTGQTGQQQPEPTKKRRRRANIREQQKEIDDKRERQFMEHGFIFGGDFGTFGRAFRQPDEAGPTNEQTNDQRGAGYADDADK